MSELILVKPSKVLEERILEYKQEYLDFEEISINGGCGLAVVIILMNGLKLCFQLRKINFAIMFMPAHSFR
ncbi:MAG: hypothetical protein RR891_05370 [Clostridium sp.]|uniref:hypothetical protein n=1 Tax=Clostridium sp. TaxID=1506 RepID=UPI00306C2594